MPPRFKPILNIAVDGKPVDGLFYAQMIKLRLIDESGKTADRLTLTFDDANNQFAPLRKGAELAIKIGYQEPDLVDKGRFKVEKATVIGSTSEGETYVVTAKAVGSKLNVPKRSGGLSASGGALEPVLIDKGDCSEWNIDSAGRLYSGTASGTLKLQGRPEAKAGAPVICSGFRSEVNGKWRAETIECVLDANGYMMTVSIERSHDMTK